MTTESLAREELLQLVSFYLGNEEYAVDISSVQEIVRMREITYVPRAPEFMEGVVNLRGKIVPVLDLRKRFGLAPEPRTKRTRIIIAKVATRVVGLIVDGVSEVLRLPAREIEPPPEMVTDATVDTAYLKGVGKLDNRLLILLELDRILAPESLSSLPA